MRLIILSIILKLVFFVTLTSCSNNSALTTDEGIELSEQLKKKFYETKQLEYKGDTLVASTEVLNFYKKSDYVPIWINDKGLTEKGEKLKIIIDSSYFDGFIPEMFHANTINSLIDSSLMDAELLLTNAFFLYISHITLGCVDSSTYSYQWKKDSLDFSIDEQLNRVKAGENLHSIIYEHEPKNWEYLQLKKGLKKYLVNFPLDTMHFKIPNIRDDSSACYNQAKSVLLAYHYLDSVGAKNDSLFLRELKKFQLQHGLKDDGIIGTWTSKSLEKSNQDRFYQAALSLEKWRWKKGSPKRYIRVNIPEFNLYFIDSGRVKRKHRVVVGAYKTQTPEFKAKMERMVTNPYWHVPYSISSTEILYHVKKDSAYLQNKGYKLFKKGEEIDPNTVDWTTIREKNFPYRVRQEGGSGNSLGKIKFLFPNIHAVFVHDTPSKRLFSNDVRAYSHGCVRLENPFLLAKSMLELDAYKMEADTLDSIVIRGEQRVLELNEPFEVQIEYFTATGDSAGNIIFHPDIYGRDEKFFVHTYSNFK